MGARPARVILAGPGIPDAAAEIRPTPEGFRLRVLPPLPGVRVNHGIYRQKLRRDGLFVALTGTDPSWLHPDLLARGQCADEVFFVPLPDERARWAAERARAQARRIAAADATLALPSLLLAPARRESYQALVEGARRWSVPA